MPRPPSSLEAKFAFYWRAAKGPMLVTEFRFAHPRRWRADFAHLPSRTMIEIEGGVWTGGRHGRGAGFTKDAEKYLEAALDGWRVIRLVDGLITLENLKRIIALIKP